VLIRNNLYKYLIVFVVIGLLFAPMPASNLWWQEAVNSGHTVLFALLVFVIHENIRSRFQFSGVVLKYTYVLFAGLMLGIVIEILQVLVQREISLNDLYRNFIGIVAGICLLAALDLKKSNHYKITTVFLIISSAGCLAVGLAPLTQLSWHYIGRTEAFPVIVDFNSNWISSFIKYDKGNYPGIAVVEVQPDWSGYNTLNFSIHSVSEREIGLVLRIHDMAHNQEFSDRFNTELLIKPGSNAFRFGLDQIQDGPTVRGLDLKNIAGVILFSRESSDWQQLKVSNIFLE
jgi:VanZ family protein